MTPPPKYLTPFALKRIVFAPTGCWIWIGALVPRGYGQLNLAGNVHWMAHRWVWHLSGRELPEHLHHRCGVKACVNPDHLVPTTRAAHNAHHMGDTCKSGHPFDEANTWIRKTGARVCRACRNQRHKGYYAAMSEPERQASIAQACETRRRKKAAQRASRSDS